ncbi:MAG: hypothetical protein N2689_00410 [Verrucomicrobiae bacterium]|nr:hypothetical protein [Verrucomicrobiae bacterium]
MTTPTLSPSAADFKDRRVGLIVFGIFVILLGCLCALLVPMMLFGHVVAARHAAQAANFRMIVPALLMYAGLAVAFIWLGIGSTLCRRWARALLLVWAWLWLICGAIGTAFLIMFLPEILASPTPQGQSIPEPLRPVVTIVVLGVSLVIYLLLPGALVLFYRSRHVKATCEARDPVTRWTDACPLPVLAVSVVLAFGAFSMLTLPLAYNSVMPFFGTLISGAPATALCLVIMSLMIWTAWATYRLEPAAWWVTVGLFAALMVSAALTFARVELIEMYRQMGFPPDQMAVMERLRFVRDRSVVWWMLLGAVPFFAYLLLVKKHFRRTV